ncbi:MAG: hypothetical protein AVDCRST_MAG09-1717, partial [uncultured Sphingomonas sp.]
AARDPRPDRQALVASRRAVRRRAVRDDVRADRVQAAAGSVEGPQAGAGQLGGAWPQAQGCTSGMGGAMAASGQRCGGSMGAAAARSSSGRLAHPQCGRPAQDGDGGRVQAQAAAEPGREPGAGGAGADRRGTGARLAGDGASEFGRGAGRGQHRSVQHDQRQAGRLPAGRCRAQAAARDRVSGAGSPPGHGRRPRRGQEGSAAAGGDRFGRGYGGRHPGGAAPGGGEDSRVFRREAVRARSFVGRAPV